MRYRGEVTLSLTNAMGNRIILKKHNAAEIGLQYVFANMLSGISTVQWIPTYVEYGGILYLITGRNKRTASISESTSNNPKYYTEFNAFIPVGDGGSTIDSMLDSDAQYTVCGSGYANSRENLYKLASISPNMDSVEIEEIKTSLGASGVDGLQININWKMYLEVDET